VSYVKLPAPVLRVAGKCLHAWWKIRKPTTFGVKVLLIHPDDPAQCLIVRHSYSDRARWGLPGGAYRPGRETPEQAGVREVFEELALTVTGVPAVLDTVCTTLEGKRDTLTIVQATPVFASFVRSPEIAEARWVGADMAAMPEGEPVSRWLERALSARTAPEPAPRSSSAEEG
jgi:8-oxo-dGTP diphosphatase